MKSLTQVGVSRFVIVTGFEAAQVEGAARAAAAGASLEFVHNSRYAETNVLTSWLLGSHHLTRDHFYVHADTAFAPELLDRLIQTGTGAVNLTLDTHRCGDEEMKLRLVGERLVEISKTMPRAVATGEFTGVMSVRADLLPNLRVLAEDLLLRDDGDALFVEAVLQELLDQGHQELFSLVDITGVPWKEIDFPEDLEAANELFLRTGYAEE